MLVTLYKSALCPRCHLAHRHLLNTIRNYPDITLETVDIVTAPRKTWTTGVRMIPAVKIETEILSSLFLSEKSIKDFIVKHL